ncbi:DMT family transporter [Zavarzinia sp. CC-PAN008]|uniref:DMT family transporter n=1 Tax=Zavarzinia sp. CC-PAN008 TaxID=3243332 RepID=UPI003F74A7E4
MRPAHVALVLIVNTMWGLNFLVVKFGLAELPPILFSALRFCGLALCLLPFLKPVPGQMRLIVAIAVLAGALHFGLVFYGLAHSDVSSAAIALQLNLPFMTILSVVLLGERIRWRRILGIVLAFSGVMAMGFDPHAFDHVGPLLICVAAAFSIALGTILMRIVRDVNAFQMQSWIAAISGPALLAMSFALETDQGPVLAAASWTTWGLVAFTIIGTSLIGHGGMFYLIQRYPVTTMAPLTLLAPVIGVVSGIVVLHEPLTTQIATGIVLTMAGLAIITIRDKRLSAEGT